MGILSWLIGGGGGVDKVAGGAERIGGIFRPNAERSAQRAHDADGAVMGQYSSEFNARNNRGWFDQFVDGMNRLVRPFITFSIFGIFIYTPIDPLKMTEVFTAWALIPAGLWTIATVIVGFFFGGRMQLKGQDFRAQMAGAAARAPEVIANIARIRELRSDSPNVASDDTDVESGAGDNQAIADWKAG